MPQIPPLDLDVMDLVARNALAGRRYGNLFRVIAHAPTMMPGFLMLGDELLHELDLDIRLREVAILRVAGITEASYVLSHHSRLARELGFSETEIEAATGKGDPTYLSPDAKLVGYYAEALTRDAEAPEAIAAALAARLPSREIVELSMVVGFYLLVSRIVRNMKVEVDTRVEGPAPVAAG